jgi:hypothetical protein
LLGHQEKFVERCTQELAALKEEHVKEVAQLKNDYETQLKSLEKKYNQEGVMAAETDNEV